MMCSNFFSIQLCKFHLNNRQRVGSSTLEFVICAPALMLFCLIAMEINERIEQRVTSAIEANNLAWSVTPGASNSDNVIAAEASKLNILGLPSDAAPTAVVANSVSYSVNKLKADGYELMVSHGSSKENTALVRKRIRSDIGIHTDESTFSGKSARVSASASEGFDAFVNNSNLKLFPQRDVEKIDLTWNLSQAGSSNKIIQTIESLASYQDYFKGEGQGYQVFDVSADRSRILSHHTRYLRRHAAYHEEEYNKQMLYGFGLGLLNSDLDSFTEKCFFKFHNEMKEDCGEHNRYFDDVDTKHRLVASIKNYAFYSCATACSGTLIGVFACIVGTCGIPQCHAIDSTSNGSMGTGCQGVGFNSVVKSMAEGYIENKIKVAISKRVSEAQDAFKEAIKNQISESLPGGAIPKPDLGGQLPNPNNK